MITRGVFANDKFVKSKQYSSRARDLKIEIMLLSIYSLILKERRIVNLRIEGKASVDDKMNSQDK